jgi:uncharacterized protein (TIGR00290 family)
MWSGGKDSALAFHRARQAGLDVRALLTFYDAESGRVRFHGTRVEVIREQVAALGAESITVGTTWPEMEAALAAQLRDLAAAGYAGVVFGDIHLADVRAWYEERVIAAGLEHVEPLWGDPPASLLEEFVGGGGLAVVTCIDLERLDEAWLGRVIDADFARDIGGLEVDPCGENGEYHSFAFAGPAFARPVEWAPGERRREGRFLQVDVASSPSRRR